MSEIKYYFLLIRSPNPFNRSRVSVHHPTFIKLGLESDARVRLTSNNFVGILSQISLLVIELTFTIVNQKKNP